MRGSVGDRGWKYQSACFADAQKASGSSLVKSELLGHVAHVIRNDEESDCGEPVTRYQAAF